MQSLSELRCSQQSLFIVNVCLLLCMQVMAAVQPGPMMRQTLAVCRC
jgi:hypothetical protein